MISKELMSEVLKENVLSVRPYIEDDLFYKNVIMYECRKDTYDIINIYELAHKCKEWAISNYGFSLHSFLCPDDTCTCEVYKFHKSTGYEIVDWFNCLSEVEAIIEACQWILDNKKEGN